MRESGTYGLGTCDSVIYELEVVRTRGHSTHKSVTLSRRSLSGGTRGCGAQGCENSPRRGTVNTRTRGRDKQLNPILARNM